ncbi:diacylglycerol kinase family protein [Microbacterium sp.]|uniref:diacylglycerol/lipid kinase family protein n=1 Tax=Microbacterium sp. TaxID=51671 RepID=UPI0025EB2E61|nr:diacylglycerol kinase family protein [Microbacterium sp.]
MTDSPRDQQAALVYNPTKVDAESLRATLTDEGAAAGWGEPLFYETTVEELGDGLARQALDRGAAAVLVAGGDGTVRAVSEAMSESGIPLTIIPSGTGNLLARNLQLPLNDPTTMVRATFTGEHRPTDIGFARITRPDGETTEHGFVVMGGMGLDAAMIANTSGDLKKRVGWIAYVGGAARSLVGAEPFLVQYRVPGHGLHRARVQSVLVANCGSLPAGLELIPEASVSDGELDIVIFQPKSMFGWLAVWRRVAWENSVLNKTSAGRRMLRLRTKDNSVRYARGTGLELSTDAPQHVQLDGDEFGEGTALTCRVVAGGLLISIPKERAAT